MGGVTRDGRVSKLSDALLWKFIHVQLGPS